MAMEVLEYASRTLMSLLQDPFSTGKRRVTYVSDNPGKLAQDVVANTSQTVRHSSYNWSDFPKYATEASGLPLSVLILLTVVSLPLSSSGEHL